MARETEETFRFHAAASSSLENSKKRKRSKSKKNKNTLQNEEHLELSSSAKSNDVEFSDIITEKNYAGKDFMKDEEFPVMHDFDIQRSHRTVMSAQDAMRILLTQVGCTYNTIYDAFKEKVVNRLREEKAKRPVIPHAEHPATHLGCRCGHSSDNEDEDGENSSSSDASSYSDSSSDDSSSDDQDADSNKKQEEKFTNTRKRNSDYMKQEIDRKRSHPDTIHPDMAFNEPGYGNDGPVCRCSNTSRSGGIRHGYYAGEERVFRCYPFSSNHNKLFHYHIMVTPFPSEKQISKTTFTVGSDEFEFEGFSIITHEPLPPFMPRLPISRWSVEYEFHYIEELLPPDSFTIYECDLLAEVIFHDFFELFDFEWKSKYHKTAENESILNQPCPVVHFMPRFVFRRGNYVKILPTKGVMAYILGKFTRPLINEEESMRLFQMDDESFNRATNKYKQNLMASLDKKPCVIRVDAFERDFENMRILMVHNTARPAAYVNVYMSKIHYLERQISKKKYMNNVGSVDFNGNAEIERMTSELYKLRNETKGLRCLQVKIPFDGFQPTGFFPDCVAHILMLILSTHHARYHMSLNVLEKELNYKFNNRGIIELAMTHSSFKYNYGTNTDHAKNFITNCGYRRKYVQEDRKEKKKGIVNLVTIMGMTNEDTNGENSPILHNERLEYLGDAVVEMIVTHHLFFMLPHHNEGGLATYRTGMVQNRNLATLAKNIHLEAFIQFTHGMELCHEAEFRHALANAFEALMAAVYLDGGMEYCDRIYSNAMFADDPEMKKVWDHVNEHQLKRDDPLGDRHLVEDVPTLTNLKKLEKQIGVEFNNIRLLAKAMTRRHMPYNELTKGHNQRLEWLGDTVLQLIISDYLYRNFPLHHEGHMSLLRTSLVSNQTQSLICDDLGLLEFVPKPTGRQIEIRTKDKADFVEAVIGALYVDRGIEHCRAFVRICFLPRLANFITSDKWNDPKSHLQQLCLMQRNQFNPKPDVPEYRVIRMEGPTNSRQYKVAVYFRNKKLAVAEARNMHEAELKAAELGLEKLKRSKRKEEDDREKKKKKKKKKSK